MKAKRRKKAGPISRERPAAPKAAPEPRWVRWIGLGVVAFGAAILLKVVLTLTSGTAWDDLETVSREGQALEYWSFVVTYFVMGAGTIWLGLSLWRSR